jgi:hypothetical protein
MRFRVENREVEMVHQVDELSGRFYWSDGKSKVYYQKNGIQFYFYGLEGDEKSALWDLFLAAPRVPMTYGRRYSFVEDLPLLLTQSQIRRTIGHLAQILMNAPKNLKGEYEISETGLSLKGRLGPLMRNAQTDFEVDPVHGILRFSVEGRAYERILAKV